MSDTAANISKTQAICSVAELKPEAMALLQPQQKPPEFIDTLMDKKLFADAVRFLAHALPRREAVWWAWMCARRAAGERPAPAVQTALEVTERWIAQPTEENRRAAEQAAELATIDTPAGCAAMGAFFSGGSIGPPDAPEVPPGPYLTAKVVSGAVIYAALGDEPAEAPGKFRSFVAQGVDVTNRLKLWEG